ncbi:Endoribonuclease Dicer-like protein 1 [Senna tora]|uniref:Endoribonuclease Dicer-like protein 1 n=1 Tax=Senna tora TaxID=362788 RepID=A0A834SNS7_9FABA|nr:Endoribonuclease Dicer-like protein 1 [Senna tora]
MANWLPSGPLLWRIGAGLLGCLKVAT